MAHTFNEGIEKLLFHIKCIIDELNIMNEYEHDDITDDDLNYYENHYVRLFNISKNNKYT